MLESVLLLVWRRRQQLSIAEVRATAQAALGGDAALDAFKEFRDQVNSVEVESQKTDMRKTLERWSKVPALSFAPMASIGPKKGGNLRHREADDSRTLHPRR